MDQTKIVELLLTAEIYNRFEELNEDDIPKEIRKLFYGKNGINRPLVVKLDVAKRYAGRNVDDVRSLPFIDFNDFNKQFKITSFDLTVKWFLKRGIDAIKRNPVLAYYYQNYDSVGVSYEDVKKLNKPKHSDKEWLKTIIAELEKNEETSDMLGLVRLYSPEDIKVEFHEVALDETQLREFNKIEVALEKKEFLEKIGVTEVGKLLFIGPPGTGKTTTARALSKKLHLPLVEVKLSMITSQFLGETSKNIEKVFEIAKKLNPCILFIDEFDYVAKTRTSDEHAAVKRAVNTLLKSIDEINLVEDGVVLIAATNHPSLLDSAVWRRFDKIIEFPQPSERIRKRIFQLSLSKVPGNFDIDELVELTEGFTGAEIKLVIREAVLNSLLTGKEEVEHELLVQAVRNVRERLNLKISY